MEWIVTGAHREGRRVLVNVHNLSGRPIQNLEAKLADTYYRSEVAPVVADGAQVQLEIIYPFDVALPEDGEIRVTKYSTQGPVWSARQVRTAFAR